MGQVLEFEARGMAKSASRRDDVLEVVQYRRAMWHAEQMLRELPLSLRVIRESHRVLLSSGRGRQRSPGEYRRIQNWIGPPGCPVEEANFVPIAAQNLADGMGAWERYIHQDGQDRLVQLAIMHAEFEALHPFLDGNGRMGRMLVPLFMWQRELIRQPAFYISAYFEANRDAYYEGLRSVSRDDDWSGWCAFFLNAVRTQAEDNLAKTEAILRLYEEMKDRVLVATNSPICDSGSRLDLPAAGLCERPVRRRNRIVCPHGPQDPSAPVRLRGVTEDRSCQWSAACAVCVPPPAQACGGQPGTRQHLTITDDRQDHLSITS